MQFEFHIHPERTILKGKVSKKLLETLDSNIKTKLCNNTQNKKIKRKPAAEKLDRSVSCVVTAVNIKVTTIRMINIKTIDFRTRNTIFRIKEENT